VPRQQVRQRRPSPRRSARREVHPEWGRRFTFPELAAAWVGAGGPVSEAQEAAATALAESGGYEKRPNSTGDGGMGPWQITPAEPGSDTLRGNARQAVRKWKGAYATARRNGLKGNAAKQWAWNNQWVAHAKGAHKQYLTGEAPDKTLLESLATGPLGDAANAAGEAVGKIPGVKPLVAVGELAAGLTELLLTPEGWRRVLKVVIGSVILLWALNQLSKAMLDVNPARGVRRVATKTPVTSAASKAATAAKSAAKTKVV